MYEVKVRVWHVMLWEFKNSNNAVETAKEDSSVYDQDVIAVHQVRNWFLMF